MYGWLCSAVCYPLLLLAAGTDTQRFLLGNLTLSNVLRFLCLRDKPFYVFGDLIDNFLRVNDKVKQILLNAKMAQLIDKPTRITATSTTLLDMTITNKPKSVMPSDTIPWHGGVQLITLTIDLKKTEAPTLR